jgi:hypothetical protein
MVMQRQYWVVSPNVQSNPQTVGAWREASVKWKAAFMGWQPNDPDHKIGRKFARGIRPGDVILIARRHRNAPEVVGFGRVVGEFKTGLAGFRPVETFGSLRRLNPFIPFSGAPNNIPFMDAIKQIAALRKLDPEHNSNHERLCRWLDVRLLRQEAAGDKKRAIRPKTKFHIGSLPSDKQLEYQVRTRRSVGQARKKEAELIGRYREWIQQQDRTLTIFKTQYIQCDAYEKARRNLIEAKCSDGREHVRMAVGQLLDYAFHSAAQLGKCHKAILLPSKPSAPRLLEWLNSLSISVIWEEGSDFLDNANGQFM